VSRLAEAGLIRTSPRPDRTVPYAIDTRDSVSPVFRSVALEAIDAWRSATGVPRLAAVANSGTLLAALWAGATGQPFWNVLVKGARTRGFGREVEPDVGVAGRAFALLDNHARTGNSLRVAKSIIEANGGVVVSAAVFTAGDDVDYSGPLQVFLPHHQLMEHAATWVTR
jgi:orotate phosphoribosyltransferase